MRWAIFGVRRLGSLADRPRNLMTADDKCQEGSGSQRLILTPPLGSVFRAVVSSVVPEAVNLDEPGWTSLERAVEDTLSGRSRRLQRQLRLLLLGVQWLPVLRYGRTFTSLDRPRQARLLSSLQDHPIQLIRTGFFGLRTLALLGYYGRPESARAIGYAADRRGWEALG